MRDAQKNQLAERSVMDLKFTVQTKIRKKRAEVFEAIVAPQNIMSSGKRYSSFFSSHSRASAINDPLAPKPRSATEMTM